MNYFHNLGTVLKQLEKLHLYAGKWEQANVQLRNSYVKNKKKEERIF